MTEILARNLQQKPVVGTDGSAIGTLHNVTIRPQSGALCELVVDPGGVSSTRATPDTDDGRFRIPVSRVTTVGDQIVIDVD